MRSFPLLLIVLLWAGGVEQLAAQSWIDDYFARVDHNQAEQPHWKTPVATTTPRLEQEIRYDILWQPHADGATTVNYSGSKGLELIPANNVEVIIAIPPYIVHNNRRQVDGFGDESFLVKYRLLSRNEQKGNYILTAFLGASIPTGSHTNGARHAVLTPTLALGKGWGSFDIQTTAGIGLPVDDAHLLGQPVTWNLTGQYSIRHKIWPEVEMNYTYFHQGPHDGKTQVFVTPGIVLGKFPIWRRLGLTVGTGLQIAASRFHTYNHGWILTTRFPF